MRHDPALREVLEAIREMCPLRFCAVAHGIGHYPEDEEIWGYFESEAQITSFWETFSFESAMQQALSFIQAIAVDVPHMNVNSVQIVDQHGRTYQVGKVGKDGHEIYWEALLTSQDEIEKTLAQAKALRSEAAFESGWDNYSTSRQLSQSAHAMRAIAEASLNFKCLAKESGEFEFCNYVKQDQK